MKPRQEERHAWEMLVVVGTFVKVQDSVGNVQLKVAHPGLEWVSLQKPKI